MSRHPLFVSCWMHPVSRRSLFVIRWIHGMNRCSLFVIEYTEWAGARYLLIAKCTERRSLFVSCWIHRMSRRLVVRSGQRMFLKGQAGFAVIVPPCEMHGLYGVLWPCRCCDTVIRWYLNMTNVSVRFGIRLRLDFITAFRLSAMVEAWFNSMNAYLGVSLWLRFQVGVKIMELKVLTFW